MKPINSLPPFKRFCVTIGNLPSSYIDSMSYYECLMWLCKYLKDTVVPAVNENATAVNELINWFNNLDVQDEIDKKLDEMAQDGTLAQIIEDYATIPELTTRVSALENYNTTKESQELTEMVVIGDSYSSRTYLDTQYELWCEKVASRLNLTLHNYADPGAGFVADGDERSSTFITQLNEAHNDTSFNNNKVGYVFIYGGTNDLRYSDQTNKSIHTSAYTNCFTNARTYFPNAKIIYLGCNTFANFFTKTMSDSERITELWIDNSIKHNSAFISKGIIAIDLTLFFIGQTGLLNGIASHPNGTAHEQIASAVINGLNSSSNAFEHTAKVAPTIDSSSSSIWSNSATLTNENICQIRTTDKGFRLYIATCFKRNAGSGNFVIDLPFNLIIPFSTTDDNLFVPKNNLVNSLMFANTHNATGIVDEGLLTTEFNFGTNLLRFYTSVKNGATATMYDVYMTVDINI